MGSVTAAGLERFARATASARTRAPASPAFNWVVVAIGLWAQTGAWLDFWAHRHLGPVSFFSLWHADFYAAGFTGVFFLYITIVRNFLRHPELNPVPAGYELGLVGTVIFPIGGVSDLLWHAAFGFETGASVALSPTHMLIFLAGALLISAPIRNAWRSGRREAQYFVAVAAGSLIADLFAFIQWFSPWLDLWPSRTGPIALPAERGVELGIAGLLITTALLTGWLLLLLKRFTLPFGTVTLILLISGLAINIAQFTPVSLAACAVAGLVGDAMIHWLRPSPARSAAYRLFGFAFALTLAGTYLLAIQFTSGVRWLPHELAGCAMGCGFVGLMLSYLGVGPAVSSERRGLASSGLAPDAREAAGVAGRQPLP